MGDSVYIPTYHSPGSLISEGYKAGFEMQEGQRKKALNQSFSESLNPDGSFNTEAFLSKASSAGIGPEAVTAWLGQKTAKSDTAAKEAMNASILEATGRKPDVLRDWFEQERQKKVAQEQEAAQEKTREQTIQSDATNYGTKQEQEAQQAIVDKQTGADRFLNPQTGDTNLPPEQTKQTGADYEEVRVGGTTATAPGYYGAGGVDTKIYEPIPKVQEKKYDVVEEALKREKGSSSAFGSPSTSTPSSFSSDLTKWEPQDDGSNEFRNYKTTLDSQLKANGLGSASEYLQKIGESTYKQNLYTPNPLAMMGKDGKPDLAAFGAENAKYEQSKVVAQGKAEEAILKARQDLIEGAKKFGVDEIASKQEKRDVEKQEAEMQGRRPEGYQYRYVTPTEATKGRDLVASYFDIRDAQARGGFAGDYAAALAKAKVDGSVNADAIVGNLIAMGAVPSDEAVKVKMLLTTGGGLTDGLMKMGAAWTAGKLKGNEANKKAWYESAKSNIAETAYTHGFDLKYKAPAKKEGSGATPDPVGDKLKEQVEKGKADRAKGATTKSTKGRSL